MNRLHAVWGVLRQIVPGHLCRKHERGQIRGVGTHIIADYAGIISLHTSSTRVEAVYASGGLTIAFGYIDIAVAAGTVSGRGIKLLAYN